jgi:adenosyl cobinamide kinase/adenosyl cobinamide phosphate guanylyltransferase
MDAPEISVYGEAKGEYTRQLCVFLVPSLETYFLNLLEEAKKQSPSAQKNLWEFQNLLQSIPDWNQDKVIRETELIQKDCKCDYIEELLTAVFIAHTKVLSAIRLTTKQKKLQITIPKIDHFLHRVLSDCARSLWTNAYLFANTNSIEKQKNLRQVSSLIQEAILQSIRGLLPVKSILREYLHADADEDTNPTVSMHK